MTDGGLRWTENQCVWEEISSGEIWGFFTRKF